jgi:hypothetical protein
MKTHHAGAELLDVDTETDEAKRGLLHLFVTNKPKKAATQPLKIIVF